MDLGERAAALESMAACKDRLIAEMPAKKAVAQRGKPAGSRQHAGRGVAAPGESAADHPWIAERVANGEQRAGSRS